VCRGLLNACSHLSDFVTAINFLQLLANERTFARELNPIKPRIERSDHSNHLPWL